MTALCTHLRITEADNFLMTVALFHRPDIFNFFSLGVIAPLLGLGLLLIHEDFCGFLITHNNTPQSVGLLWTSDQLIPETSN